MFGWLTHRDPDPEAPLAKLCAHRWLYHQSEVSRVPSVPICMDCQAIDWPFMRKVIDDFCATAAAVAEVERDEARAEVERLKSTSMAARIAELVAERDALSTALLGGLTLLGEILPGHTYALSVPDDRVDEVLNQLAADDHEPVGATLLIFAEGTAFAEIESTAVRDANADADRFKADALSCAKLVADMHAAAVGEVRGPIRGVVEDVQDVRTAWMLAEKRVKYLEELPEVAAALQIVIAAYPKRWTAGVDMTVPEQELTKLREKFVTALGGSGHLRLHVDGACGDVAPTVDATDPDWDGDPDQIGDAARAHRDARLDWEAGHCTAAADRVHAEQVETKTQAPS